MRNLLVLTSTISPQTQISMKRNEQSIRLQDYLNAIEYYASMQHKDLSIVLVENSDSLNALRNLLNKKFTKMQFVQAPKDIKSGELGKSEGEINMLRYLASEGFLDDFDYIWKVTGRIIVANIQEIIDSIQSEISVYRYKDSHSCDSKFFGMNVELFKKFVKEPVKFDENKKTFENVNSNTFRSMENYLASFCVRYSETTSALRAPKTLPLYRGFSASTGKKIDKVHAKIYWKVTQIFRPLVIKLLGNLLP